MTVLDLFEGMDEKQARKFRGSIMPTLQELRARILAENEQGENEQSKKEVSRNGKMQGKNKRGRTVQNVATKRQ